MKLEVYEWNHIQDKAEAWKLFNKLCKSGIISILIDECL